MGIEPTNTGFADQRVSHFATGARIPPYLLTIHGRTFCEKLLRLRGGSQVRLHRLVAGKDFVGLFVGDGAGDDDVVALLPVGRSCDLVPGGELEGVEHADDFVEVAAGGHGIGYLKLDALVGTNDEDGADRSVVGRGSAFAAVAGVAWKHVVELRDLQCGVADDGVVDLVAADVLDVLLPLAVAVDGVDREADDLGSALRELVLESGDGTEFGGADGSEVLGVRKENGPSVTDPFMEVNRSLGGLSGEIGGNVINAERHN